LKRFALIAVLALLCAGVAAAPGSSASFDDTNPCPASGPLLVCPAAEVGQPYSLQLRALAGCDNYWWEFTVGSLPPGLSMSSSGLISGTPTATGETDPWVQVHDLTADMGGPSWCGGDNKSQRQFVFTVSPGLSIQQQSVPGGTINQPYSVQFTALSVTNINPVQGQPAQATWSIKSGSLPAGVSLSSSGLLSGTPTAEGSYTFVVQAAGGGNTTDTETETLVVRQPLTVTSGFTAAAKAEVGVDFRAPQTAAGGSGAFTWSVSKGALPTGLTLGPDGSVSGAPALAGRFSFTLTVTDSEGRTKNTDVTLVVAKPLTFSKAKLRTAKAGWPYRAKVLFTGGVAPLNWTIRGKVPKGLKVTKTGLLLGTPKAAGTYRFTVSAVDALGVSAKTTLTLIVK
jgi:hypothetical protein